MENVLCFFYNIAQKNIKLLEKKSDRKSALQSGILNVNIFWSFDFYT